MQIPQPLSKRGLALLCTLLLGCTYHVLAQTTVTISSGINWTDALLYSKSGNTNYATYSHFAATAWTNGGADYKRTLVKFNLSSIPAGVTIQSAKLYLYSDPTVTSSSAWNGNSQLSGSNAIYFEKVTGNWSETAVTWNNQPATTTTGRIWYPASASTTENIQVDITSFVQGWVNSPATNYGLKMRLENEAYYRSRTYASENHSNSSIRPKLVITYSTSTDPVAGKLDYMFAQLDKSQVPTGFLEEFGGAFVPLDIFNGVLTDSNRVNMDVWRMAYASLQSSRIYGTNPLGNLPSVNSSIKNTTASSAAIPIAMVYSRYSYIRGDAFIQNLLKYENEQVKDVAGRTQSPYLQQNLFIASPTKNRIKNGTVSLVFKSNLFYNTTGKAVQSLAVDFANGNGYVAATWDSPVSATYSSTGLKLIKIKITFTDNSTMQCYSQIEVENVAGVTTLAYPETADQTVAFGPNATHSGGDIFIAYGNNNDGILDRPFIVLEGYDPSSISTTLANPYNYENFIDRINTPNQFNFNDELDLAGYDLIFLNYRDGTDDILRNAALFEEVVNWVNSNKAIGAEDNVVMGISMGGLVSRYGLARMTKAGLDPQTRLLITHDSPHRGANVPLGFQHLFTTLPNVVTRGIKLAGMSEQLQAAVDLFNAPATTQMLIVRSVDGVAVQNTFLNNIYQPMVTFNEGDTEPDYEFIATSQGSECGNELFAPHSELASGSGEFYISPIPWIYRTGMKGNAIINALPSPNATSRRITYVNLHYTFRLFWYLNINIDLINRNINAPTNLLPWDGAPGGTNSLIETEVEEELIHWGEFLSLSGNGNLTGEFTFVPTVSALDVVNVNITSLYATYSNGISYAHPTRADNFITQNRIGASTIFNIPHTAFTARNAEWIFDEMENTAHNANACTNECAPDITITSGGGDICSGGAVVYSIPDLGPNALSYNWTVGSGLQIQSGHGSNSITVTGSSNGQYWLQVSVNTPCGILTDRKEIPYGIADEDLVISGPTSVCTNEYYWFDVNNYSGIPILSYSWGLPFGWTVEQENNVNPTWRETEIRTGSSTGSVQIMLTINTACGSRTYPYFVQVQSCNNLYSYSVSPNPTSDNITVRSITKSSDGSESNAKAPVARVKLELYKVSDGSLVKSYIMNGNKYTFDTRAFMKGNYILRIVEGDEIVEMKQLIFE
jgi:hypothetical protein